MGPNILETLKMQGVEQFGDFAIQIRLKIMTKPGEQFLIRRRAYALIKKAFDENGIKFAFPTVQVAGGEASAAVAQQGLELVQHTRALPEMRATTKMPKIKTPARERRYRCGRGCACPAARLQAGRPPADSASPPCRGRHAPRAEQFEA